MSFPLNDDRRIRLDDLKARQLAGERMPCPRCGRDAMDEILMHNAFSRHVDMYICASCGMDEALLDFKRAPKSMREWACLAQSEAPEHLPVSELVSRIMTEHIKYLTMLYERWLEEHEYEDFKAYQDAAKHRCPGLIELQSNPFVAVYQGEDGKIAVRFENGREGIRVTAEAAH